MGLALVDESLTAGVSGSTDFPLSDRARAWDAGAANQRWQKACGIDGDKGDWAKFHSGFFWYDSKNPNRVTSHKLPFVDVINGTPTAIWRGVTAGAARLSSTQIPSGDKSGVQSKMGSYYDKAEKQFKDPSIEPPWESKSEETKENETNTITLLKPEYIADLFDRGLISEEMFAAAATGKCADCGHMAMAHGGANNMGACSMKGCDCTGFDDGSKAAANSFVFGVGTGTSTETALTVTLADMVWTTGSSGTWTITQDDGNAAAPIVFTFDEETYKRIRNPGKKTTSPPKRSGHRKGLEGVKIPPSRGPMNKPIFPRAVTPRSAESEDFDAVGVGGPDMPLPVQHQPGEKRPRKNPTVKAPASTLPPPGSALAWTATLAPEAQATDDGRIFAPGSITWRELPLSLMAMTKTADGHDGAEVCGRIDRIWRDGNMIRASGTFDTGDFGREIARLVNDGTLRGVSVDIAPQKVDMAYRSEVVDENGNWLDTAPEESSEDGPSPLDLLFGGDKQDPVIYVVRKAVLGMATVCPFQAFADAKIEPAASLVSAASDAIWTVTMDSGMTIVAKSLTAAGEPAWDATIRDEMVEQLTEALMTPVEVITASAAGLAVDAPPLAWFDPPNLPELTALTVDDDGRVYGHAAAWGTCHIGIPGECTTAPHSMTNYSYYHLKEVICDDGSRVSCGTVTMDTGHAGQSLGRAAAAAHYDDTGLAVADVVCGEDEYGIWVAGAIRPDADAEAVRRLRGAALSGDWRNVNGNLELVALLAVNVPGFPIPRVRAELTASAAGLEVTALVAAGAHLGLDGLTAAQRAEWAEISTIATDEWGRLNRLALES